MYLLQTKVDGQWQTVDQTSNSDQAKRILERLKASLGKPEYNYRIANGVSARITRLSSTALVVHSS